jgi:hypothetical protein
VRQEDNTSTLQKEVTDTLLSGGKSGLARKGKLEAADWGFKRLSSGHEKLGATLSEGTHRYAEDCLSWVDVDNQLRDSPRSLMLSTNPSSQQLIRQAYL